MVMSNLYYAIMTKKEVNIIKDSLELCMYAITSKMSSVGFKEGYNSKHYCELCSQYAKYVTLSTDIEIAMNHDDEKNDRIMSNLYYATMTKEEVDVIIESFKTTLDIIEHRMSLAEFDAGYDDMYYCELGSEYAKYETFLTNFEVMMEYNEDK